MLALPEISHPTCSICCISHFDTRFLFLVRIGEKVVFTQTNLAREIESDTYYYSKCRVFQMLSLEKTK